MLRKIISRIVFGAVCLFSISSHALVSAAAVKEIKVGLLVDKSGYETSSGQQIQKAMEFAVDESNRLSLRSKNPVKIQLMIRNTQGDPQSALEHIEAMKEAGVSLVFGPPTEAELNKVMTYVEKHKMLLVNVSSLPSGLLKSKTNLFQMLPGANELASMSGNLIKNDQMSSVILVHTSDDAAVAQTKTYRAALTKSKIKIAGQLSYDDKSEGLQDMMSSLIKLVSAARTGQSNSDVAILLVGKTREADLMSLAKNYPMLHKTRWYGTDVSLGTAEIVGNSELADFAADIQFKNTFVKMDLNQPDIRRVYNLLKMTFKQEPDVRGLMAYQAFKTLQLSKLDDIQNMQSQVRENLKTTSPTASATTISNLSVVRRNNRVVWDKAQ